MTPVDLRIVGVFVLAVIAAIVFFAFRFAIRHIDRRIRAGLGIGLIVAAISIYAAVPDVFPAIPLGTLGIGSLVSSRWGRRSS